MAEWLRELWTDKSAFARLMRAALFAIGTAVTAGQVPAAAGSEWLGPLLVGAGGLFAAGQRNPRQPGPDA